MPITHPSGAKGLGKCSNLPLHVSHALLILILTSGLSPDGAQAAATMPGPLYWGLSPCGTQLAAAVAQVAAT